MDFNYPTNTHHTVKSNLYNHAQSHTHTHLRRRRNKQSDSLLLYSWNILGQAAIGAPQAMPALQLLSHFVPKKTRPFSVAPFSCRQNSSATAPRFYLKMSSLTTRHSSLASVAPLETILFDIDGTLADSDPIHYYAFREMLQEVGFNGGTPITEEFFIKNISGMHNEELCYVLFPDWDIERARKFFDDKEAMFRRLAAEQMKPVTGLDKLCKWVEDHGLRRAAVTNAPRANAEMMISLLGLEKFFELVIIGSECERAKPFPDPYLKALEGLGVSSEHAFIFEDSVSGIEAGVGAGMPVIGLATRNPESLLYEAGATMVIKDYTESELWSALEEVEKKRGEVKVSV